MMQRANASHASGLVAVSRDVVMAASGAPARPLLRWNGTPQWRLAANHASTSRDWFSGSSSDAGIQAEV